MVVFNIFRYDIPVRIRVESAIFNGLPFLSYKMTERKVCTASEKYYIVSTSTSPFVLA